MTSEAGLLAGPFLSLKKGTRSVPKTSSAKMSLLIFIAESHDMHPKGVPCRKWGVKCSNDQEKNGRKAVCHCASYSVILSVAKNPVKFYECASTASWVL